MNLDKEIRGDIMNWTVTLIIVGTMVVLSNLIYGQQVKLDQCVRGFDNQTDALEVVR